MKNTKKGSTTIILLIIVIVILLGVIGYSYFKPTQSKDVENASQTTTDKQEVGEPIKNTPKVFETTNINNTAPELLAYSGKTSSGVNFTIKYPSSWTYYKFSCNADGVAFWPKTNVPDFSKGGACGMNSFLDGAPIVVSTMSQPQIQLRNDNYKIIFDQMKTSLSY